MKRYILFSLLLVVVVTPVKSEPQKPDNPNVELSPLHTGVAIGETKKIKLLLSKGVDVNCRDNDGYTPLFYAVWKKNVEMAKLLLACGAKVNLADRVKGTPLHYAVWFNDKDMVELLVSKGANITAEDRYGKMPLHYAVMRSGTGLTDSVIKGKALNPSIYIAAAKGDIRRVKKLVKEGTNIDAKDKIGWTALLWATSMGQEDTAEYLIEKGASIDVKTDDGDTLLHRAALVGAARLVKRFVARNIEVDANGVDGLTPLHCAVSQGHKDIAEFLLTKGANQNSRDDEDDTPLHTAAGAGYEDIVELLLARGSDVTAKDDLSWTPLHIACLRGRKDVAELLIDSGADINAKDKWGGTALHVACSRGHKDVVRLLLSKGADIDAKNERGNSPLKIALSRNHGEIVQLLRQRTVKAQTLVIHVDCSQDSLRLKAVLGDDSREYSVAEDANALAKLKYLAGFLPGDVPDKEKYGDINNLLTELGECIYEPISDFMGSASEIQFIINRDMVKYPFDILHYGDTQLFLSKPVSYSFEKHAVSQLSVSTNWVGLIASDVTADPERGCLLAKVIYPKSEYFDVWGLTPRDIEEMDDPDFILISTHGSVSDEDNDSMTLGAEKLVPKNFSGKSPKLVYFDSCGLGVSLEFIDVFQQAGTCYYLGPIWSNEAGISSTKTIDLFFSALLKDSSPSFALFEARKALYETFRLKDDFGMLMYRAFPFRVYQLN